MEVKEASASYAITATPYVMRGYKQTEVGMIPEDWDVKPLSDFFSFSGGLPAPRAQLGSRGHCYLHYGDIHTSSKSYVDVDIEHVELPKLDVRLSDVPRKSILSDGDVVFVDASEDDEGTSKHQVIRNPRNIPFISGLHTIVAKSKSNDLTNGYKCHCFQTRKIKKQFLFYSVGTKVSGISKSNIGKILLPIPSAPEQEAIAEALSDADALIESLEQLLAKKRHLKQGAMQQLLTGKKRLPGFSGEWEMKRLGDLGLFLKGSGVRKDESLSGDLPCIRYGEIYTKHSDYVKVFHSWISQKVATTAKRLKQGDLLFAGSGETKEEIGKCVAFVNNIEAYAGGDIVILRPENSNSTFLGYYLNTVPINRQKASKGQGDAVVHISSAALSSIEIKIPKTEEQTAIAAILSDMDAELAALEAKLAKARRLKQGMMQELLTGRIRLV